MRDPGTMLPADPIRHLLTLECADCCIGVLSRALPIAAGAQQFSDRTLAHSS